MQQAAATSHTIILPQPNQLYATRLALKECDFKFLHICALWPLYITANAATPNKDTIKLFYLYSDFLAVLLYPISPAVASLSILATLPPYLFQPLSAHPYPFISAADISV